MNMSNFYTKPALVILAAGMSSRYGKLKQIDSIGPYGNALLEYTIYDAIEVGFRHIVFILRKEIHQQIKDFFLPKIPSSITQSYINQSLNDIPSGFSLPPQRKKPWGTAHATLSAREVVTTSFATVNSDDYYGRNTLLKLYEALRDSSEENQYFLAGYKLNSTTSHHGSVSRALCNCDDNNNLLNIAEHLALFQTDEGVESRNKKSGELIKRFTGEETVSMNLYGLTPFFFTLADRRFTHFFRNPSHHEAEFLTGDVVNYFIKNGDIKVKVIPSNDQWFGMTYKEDQDLVRNRLKELVEKGHYPQELWA